MGQRRALPKLFWGWLVTIAESVVVDTIRIHWSCVLINVSVISAVCWIDCQLFDNKQTLIVYGDLQFRNVIVSYSNESLVKLVPFLSLSELGLVYSQSWPIDFSSAAYADSISAIGLCQDWLRLSHDIGLYNVDQKALYHWFLHNLCDLLCQ